MPKLIIACRHGEYAAAALTEFGKKQAQTLAEAVQKKINGAAGVFLATSPLTRTIETAGIIGKQLGVEWNKLGVLEYDTFHCGDGQMKEVMDGVGDNEVVVVVTHFEAPSGIINAFSWKHFKKRVDCEEIPKGTALCLSLESGDVIRLP